MGAKRRLQSRGAVSRDVLDRHNCHTGMTFLEWLIRSGEQAARERQEQRNVSYEARRPVVREADMWEEAA